MKRNGNAAITVAISITTLMMFAALAIDIGAHRVHVQKAKVAAEAAAHAAASQLDGTGEGIAAAYSVGVEVGNQNKVTNDALGLTAGDITLGCLDSAGNFVTGCSAATTTAARVDVNEAGIPTFFAGVALQQPTLDAAAAAIAVGGGPRQASCPFPIAIPSCALPEAGVCGLEISMSGNGADNAAWAIPGYTNPNATSLNNSMDPTICGAQASTADVLALHNGAINSVLTGVIDYMVTYGEAWDTAEFGAMPAQEPDSSIATANYGIVARRLGMVFDESTCSGSYTADGVDVLGYVTLVIYDVKTAGSSPDKWIKLRVACDESNEPSGGGFYGTTAPPRFINP